ncbi:membrane protein [bacteria symbiont BFo1 of Frankliniella occidentalis]|jgi:diguanylate cyclase (GGDEF)-like protein|uniref:EAL domain-containing protein n=1 Tax=Erwinia aphidicola TaxID=68334 RepID=A0ABU8DES2_ERWAP|nr:bifunctional diguanylate cyclase/phosphodiesterase [Erwinia aphidicola]KMV72632.1 membrane protein [bacteria symbiont BFo1 of Frankliniella occidentalis]PIJ59301.1 bifunctional diguanylate cyclase/phosphodiesterase [Erwinia sp. OLMDLW33]KYP86473.1 membrane protein [bacteria symbiont BFo1 of Frankliniella occidentalis]KYP92002.1 membrane protein [bacteria symbiont BFo1 of Frankliniella occidentalis]CAH0224713.1 putative signaling protein CC_0091 [Erwinia aphidicola]
MLMSSYDQLLVIVSFIVAFLASYTALDMAGRVATSTGKVALVWLFGGGFAMGVGIWSMHFIGMLAMSLPMVMSYSASLTVLSMVIAVAASIFALWIVCYGELPWYRLCGGAIVMGSGVVAMHYTGMAALMVNPGIVWDWRWIWLSVAIALGASGAALWLAFHLRRGTGRLALMRSGAALIMGIAIAGMHYTGMAAASFPASSHATHLGVNSSWLAILVVVVTLAILGITLLVSMLDARLQARTSVLASSLAEANRELAQLALHDNLTRLPNRILLEDRLDQAINKASRENSKFALMFMDLDGFKAVNDAFGHHIGDSLLIAVTERMKEIVQGHHTLARLGGDEFVLLIEIEDPNDAATVADALVKAVERPFDISRYELVVSLSIGIAVFPGDGIDERELMFNADAAMYHTKNNGRNGHSFFQPSMNTIAQNQLQLINDLWLAKDNNELRLFYQPKFCAPRGPIIGFEALLRWQHPRRGLLAPDVFLPLAEKTGLIVTMGNWVIDEACRQLREWHLQGNTDWSVAVNLSALQFEQAGLVETVVNALETHRIPPELLTLEVTETTAMRDPDESVRILTELTELGVKASIDDFGTGYSSLLYLKRLPASELKIDRAFVNELQAQTEDATIVTAIVALAQTLNLKVVAEGVETAEQQQFLTGLGCNTLQGYLLGRPVPPDQVPDLKHFVESEGVEAPVANAPKLTVVAPLSDAV